MLHKLLARLSRRINRLTKGNPGETLCGRMARTRGHWCLFCRVVGWALRDPDHCWRMRLHELRRG